MSVAAPRIVSRLAACVAAGIFLVGTASAGPQVHDQPMVADTFSRICLSGFPDVTRIARAAERRRLQKVSETQWSSKNYSLNVLVAPAGQTTATARIDLGQLGVRGWDAVSIPYGVRNPGGACALLASTPPKNLYRAVANAVAAYGKTTVRVRAGGNAAVVRSSLNSRNATVNVKPERLQGHRDFATIIIEQRR